ncbi:hypothetical protein DFH11DRAFT_1546399 [Phellopilus nigrolimitatus]|nr:hypothetical protein DFH11DRAFT_1546399 [Phellopilus nigrolimitatus]
MNVEDHFLLRHKSHSDSAIAEHAGGAAVFNALAKYVEENSSKLLNPQWNGLSILQRAASHAETSAKHALISIAFIAMHRSPPPDVYPKPSYPAWKCQKKKCVGRFFVENAFHIDTRKACGLDPDTTKLSTDTELCAPSNGAQSKFVHTPPIVVGNTNYSMDCYELDPNAFDVFEDAGLDANSNRQKQYIMRGHDDDSRGQQDDDHPPTGPPSPPPPPPSPPLPPPFGGQQPAELLGLLVLVLVRISLLAILYLASTVTLVLTQVDIDSHIRDILGPDLYAQLPDPLGQSARDLLSDAAAPTRPVPHRLSPPAPNSQPSLATASAGSGGNVGLATTSAGSGGSVGLATAPAVSGNVGGAPPSGSKSGPHSGSLGDCDMGVRWYVVFKGYEVGVFDDWSTVQGLTSGVPGGSQRRYGTRAEATRAYNEALVRGEVVRVERRPPSPTSDLSVRTVPYRRRRSRSWSRSRSCTRHQSPVVAGPSQTDPAQPAPAAGANIAGFGSAVAPVTPVNLENGVLFSFGLASPSRPASSHGRGSASGPSSSYDFASDSDNVPALVSRPSSTVPSSFYANLSTDSAEYTSDSELDRIFAEQTENPASGSADHEDE